MGVRKTPIRFDAVAAATVAATLPRAIAVKPMDDWIVEGRHPRKMSPGARLAGSTHAGRAVADRVRMGKSRKVEARTRAWSRHWVAPAITASRERRAPCRKKTSAMPTLTAMSRMGRISPRAGRNEARITMPKISMR